MPLHPHTHMHAHTLSGTHTRHSTPADGRATLIPAAIWREAEGGGVAPYKHMRARKALKRRDRGGGMPPTHTYSAASDMSICMVAAGQREGRPQSSQLHFAGKGTRKRRYASPHAPAPTGS